MQESDPAFLEDKARTDHRSLDQLAEDVLQRRCECEPLLVRGYVVEKILSEAKRLGADMIVMGAHGHGRLHDMLVGSTTEGVLHKSPVPVLIVPARMGEMVSHPSSGRGAYA
jgi:nucleotide-binding universal stress UspA family protein